MVKVGDRRGEDEKNLYDATIVPVRKLLGTTRADFEAVQVKIPDVLEERYKAGKFRRIEHDGSSHILFRTKDGGTIAYLVPKECLSDRRHVDALTTSI